MQCAVCSVQCAVFSSVQVIMLSQQKRKIGDRKKINIAKGDAGITELNQGINDNCAIKLTKTERHFGTYSYVIQAMSLWCQHVIPC